MMQSTSQVTQTALLAVLGIAQALVLFVLADLRARMMRLESKFMFGKEKL